MPLPRQHPSSWLHAGTWTTCGFSWEEKRLVSTTFFPHPTPTYPEKAGMLHTGVYMGRACSALRRWSVEKVCTLVQF